MPESSSSLLDAALARLRRSRFIGSVAEVVQLAGQPAIVPSIEGSAYATGMNTLWIDDADPFWRGFQVI